MKEEKKSRRMRCERLKTLKLCQRNTLNNDNNEQESKLDDKNIIENNENNENKINNNKKLYKTKSCQNFISKINSEISKNKILDPLKNKREKNESGYEIEKGIIKQPLCLFSKNKFHFGTTRLVNPNILQNEPNHNISTKMSEQNNLITKSNFKKIFQFNRTNSKKSTTRKSQNNIRLKKNHELNSNKINLYKRYNNGTGLDKHIILNKSCSDNKSKIGYYAYINNTLKKNIPKYISSKSNKNQIYINNNINNSNNKYKEKQSSMSTLEYSNVKTEKKKQKKLLNSTGNIKRESKIKRDLSKYHFVMNNFLIKIKEADITEEIKIKNFNKNEYNILKRENEKLFSHFRSIIPINKFSEKFRDPLNNSFDREIEKERQIKEKNIIKKDILPGIKLLKEMDIEIQKRKIIKKILKGKALMRKLKKLIIRNMEYIKRLNVSYNEIINKYKRSPYAFNYFKTEELILAIRNKNYDLCCDILNNFKYIVLDFDYFHYTPLHWAVKNNFYQIIPKLISYGAPINEQNFMGETPLHISTYKNYYESTALLMIYLASPFIKDKNNRKPIECTTDLQLIFIFKKITELHLKYLILRQKNFYDNVQKDFIDFISVEFSNQLNPEALDLINNLK